MIVVRMQGGVGNQLFQYACGRALAIRRQTALLLDLSVYDEAGWGTYLLDKFNIQARPITKKEHDRLFAWNVPGRRRIGRALARVTQDSGLWHVTDLEEGHDRRLERYKGNLYLQGYWQSDKYFSQIESVLRQELQLSKKPSDPTRRMAERIGSERAIGVSIRRGDYVSVPEFRRKYVNLSEGYYEAGVEFLRRQVDASHCFIFSDDPDWVQDNIRLKLSLTVMRENFEASRYHEDLYLMSLCRHFVIANSTFSWWGAWLSKSPGKQVVAPSRWLRENPGPPVDLLPEDWHRM